MRDSKAVKVTSRGESVSSCATCPRRSKYGWKRVPPSNETDPLCNAWPREKVPGRSIPHGQIIKTSLDEIPNWCRLQSAT
jgi:hypothetical protein